MFENITLEMRLEDLGYKPTKAPDYTLVLCDDGVRFTKPEKDAMIDLATIYDIGLYSIHKNYAKFYDADVEVQ